MRVLFISTWPAASGLSKATVHPHLEVLASDDRVDVVHYISMETDQAPELVAIDNVVHEPIVDVGGRGLLRKALSHRRRLSEVRAIARRVKADYVICRGAPAGVFGVDLKTQLQIPFYVESFEPHAERMVDAGIWRRNGPKFTFQRRWEERCKREAAGLITVSDAYARYLTEIEHVDANWVRSVPCWVDATKFRRDETERKKIRRKLGIVSATVCAYVGKFGGLYYEDDAFKALAFLSQIIGEDFFVIVLTPDSAIRVLAGLSQAGVNTGQAFVENVPHADVYRFLSAADFAVSFPRSTNWSFSCSPIKHSEYWACGLPVLIPENVGDEAEWVESEGLGAVMNVGDPESIKAAMDSVLELLGQEDSRGQIRDAAIRLRGKDLLVSAYKDLVTEQEAKEKTGRLG